MKRPIIYFLSIILLFAACKQVVKSVIKKATDSVQRTSVSVSVKKAISTDTIIKAEYLDWDSVKINGKAHAISTKAILYRAFAKPDSIVSPDMSDICGSYFEETFKYVYIKGCQFELRGDSIVIGSLNFKKSRLKLVVNTLTLDSNTTLASLSKVFPNAVKNQYPVIEGKDKFMTIMLAVDKTRSQTDTEEVWLLFFKDGKLTTIDHHIDC